MEMDINVKIKATESKDHYSLSINGNYLGVFERSDYRYMLETIDGAINVGLAGEKRQPMTEQAFARMVAEAKMAAEQEGDDCTMCGS